MSEHLELAIKVFDRTMQLIEYGINPKKIDSLIDAFELLFNDSNGFFWLERSEYLEMVKQIQEAYEIEYGFIDESGNMIYIDGGENEI